MESHLQQLLQIALNKVLIANPLPSNYSTDKLIFLETSKNPKHGDYASNLALILSKPLKKPPQLIAQQLIDNLPKSPHLKQATIAGAGFINFLLQPNSQVTVIINILRQGKNFGLQETNTKDSICIEFVSANPTGPLHVGHGRGAAFGDSLANLLQTTGHKVHREYYINDAGRQMDILATSVWLRYLNLVNDTNEKFPSNGYLGDYIWDLAASIHREYDDKFYLESSKLYQNISADEINPEQHIDDLITKTKDYLQANYAIIFQLAVYSITADIKQDLAKFKVKYDYWFSEQSLASQVDDTIKLLEQSQNIYTKQQAKWFKSTAYGDEKDRVVVRNNGLKTYFASDLAYHKNKAERGFDQIINIWGADHHGYIARVAAGMTALGIDATRLQVLLMQFAHLFRGKKPVKMSTRSGSFVTLAQLYNEVGVDAARYFYVARKPEQHLDFDLELAKTQNSDNPVYYIQYAHARVFQVLQKLSQENLKVNKSTGIENLNLLTSAAETALISRLNKYLAMLAKASDKYAPHLITTYLRELAQDFHSFYNNHKIIIDNPKLRNARICLILATAQIIANGLAIIAVSAPQKM